MVYSRLIRSALFIRNCCVPRNNPSVKNRHQHLQYASHDLHYWLKQIILDIPFCKQPNFYGPIAHFLWPWGDSIYDTPCIFSIICRFGLSISKLEGFMQNRQNLFKMHYLYIPTFLKVILWGLVQPPYYAQKIFLSQTCSEFIIWKSQLMLII